MIIEWRTICSPHNSLSFLLQWVLQSSHRAEQSLSRTTGSSFSPLKEQPRWIKASYMWNSITTTIDKFWFVRWAAWDAKWWNRFGIALLSSVTYFNVLWWKSHPTQASFTWHLDWSFCHYRHTNESLRGRNSCTWLITIQLWHFLRWPIYLLNSVDNTKLPWRQ